MMLVKKEENLGKAEAVYEMLNNMVHVCDKYNLNIWDMKNQDDTIALIKIERILFFKDCLVTVSKRDGNSMFINLNHVMSIDMVYNG